MKRNETILDMTMTGINIKHIMQEKGYTVKDVQNYLNLSTPQATDCGDRDESHTPKEWMGEFNLEESEEWFCVWQDIVSTLSEKITEVLPRVSGELENALFTGMGGLLYLKYDIEKPLLPQVKENGVKALGIVSGIDDMMKMFGH